MEALTAGIVFGIVSEILAIAFQRLTKESVTHEPGDLVSTLIAGLIIIGLWRLAGERHLLWVDLHNWRMVVVFLIVSVLFSYATKAVIMARWLGP